MGGGGLNMGASKLKVMKTNVYFAIIMSVEDKLLKVDIYVTTLLHVNEAKIGNQILVGTYI